MAWPKGKPRSPETIKKMSQALRSRPTRPLQERFWEKVEKGDPDDCWDWTASLHSAGYGQIGYDGRPRPAHQVAWFLATGEWPQGDVDHECHNRDATCPGGLACPHRRCVNPAHLRVVPRKMNPRASRLTQPSINAAKTHCVNGHAFDPANTYIRPDGYRDCRVCRAATEARRRAKKGHQ